MDLNDVQNTADAVKFMLLQQFRAAAAPPEGIPLRAAVEVLVSRESPISVPLVIGLQKDAEFDARFSDSKHFTAFLGSIREDFDELFQKHPDLKEYMEQAAKEGAQIRIDTADNVARVVREHQGEIETIIERNLRPEVTAAIAKEWDAQGAVPSPDPEQRQNPGIPGMQMR